MCVPFSCIVTMNKVLWNGSNHSHSDILKNSGISDVSRRPKFVRVEITGCGHPNTWTYNVDQDYLPDWYEEVSCELAARTEFDKWVAQYCHFDGDHVVDSGEHFFYGNSTGTANGGVARFYDNSTGTVNGGEARFFNSSTGTVNGGVARFYGNSTVTVNGGDARFYGNSTGTVNGGFTSFCENSTGTVNSGYAYFYGNSTKI